MSSSISPADDTSDTSLCTGACVICMEPTDDKMPCINCRDHAFCCKECIERRIKTSSDSLCFVCRDKHLYGSLRNHRSRVSIVEPDDEEEIRHCEMCRNFLNAFIMLVSIFFVYILGATCRYLDGEDKHFTSYAFGYPENDNYMLDNFLAISKGRFQ